MLATQNPIEYEGTYPLPEAQLDRFILRTSIGYPGRDDEVAVLDRRLERGQDELTLERVVDAETLIAMQQAVEDVHVSEPVRLYMVDLVAATRTASRVQVGASPRGSLALLKLSRCRAALAGRDFVLPDDVKAVAGPALAHRLTLRPELWVQDVRGEGVILEVLESVPTPADGGGRTRDAGGDAEAARLPGARGGSAAWRRSSSAGRSWSRSPCPLLCSSRSGWRGYLPPT